jgi:hypothetical protein
MGANLLPWNAVVRLQARTSTIGEKVWIVMAKIIEFYIPNSFQKKWLGSRQNNAGK